MDDARPSLEQHAIAKAFEARAKYGVFDRESFLLLLQDRAFVRHPCALGYSATALEPGEIAWVEPRGEVPAAGFDLWVHPRFEGRDHATILVAAYQLVVVNYGDIATPELAELFGATLLGLEPDEYYRQLCALADENG